MRFNWPVLKCPRLAGFEVSPEAMASRSRSTTLLRFITLHPFV